jgi:hypothetical protein
LRHLGQGSPFLNHRPPQPGARPQARMPTRAETG